MALAILLVFLAALYFVTKVGRERTIVFNQQVIQQFQFKPIRLERMLAFTLVYIMLFFGLLSFNLFALCLSLVCSAWVLFLLYENIQRRSNKDIAIKSLGYLMFYGVIGLAGIACVYVVYHLVGHDNQDNNDRSSRLSSEDLIM